MLIKPRGVLKVHAQKRMAPWTCFGYRAKRTKPNLLTTGQLEPDATANP